MEKGFVIAVTAMLLLINTKTGHAATYTVGDGQGWSFTAASSWPHGKRFKSGDTLVFKYDNTLHSVVSVDKASFDSCQGATGSKEYDSGNDHIRIGKGSSYFICGLTDHCQAGMKMVITAT